MKMSEQTIESKVCKKCNQIFDIYQSDQDFYDKISPNFSGEKFQIPKPTFCPDCREQRRTSFVNERNLYKVDTEDGKSVVSMYSPDKNYKIYDFKTWWSDTYDSREYTQEIDFNKSFIEQFGELLKKVPKFNLAITNCENSEYNNYLHDSKNSYLSIGSTGVEDASYILASASTKKSFDVWWSNDIENSYMIFNSYSLYKCFFSQDCGESRDLFFCKKCQNCSDCILSYGLVGKEYYIMNKPYTKEEYERKKEELGLVNYNNIQQYNKIFIDFLQKQIHMYVSQFNAKSSVGDYMYDTEKCYRSFNVAQVKDLRYVYEGSEILNAVDGSRIYFGGGNILEGAIIDRSFQILYSFDIADSSYIYYSSSIFGSKNCFLCSGLKNKQYCILNKQYTKEEYEKIVPQIIKKMQEDGEWGEFFPSNLSLFGYNETVANENYPLKKEEALGKEFIWSDYEKSFPKVEKIIPASKLPLLIKDIPDDILNWAIECEISKKPFKINSQELLFYREHDLPIPRRHPDQRYLDMIQLRNPRKLFNRECDKCSEEIQTTYSPERPEKVYCEECYNKEFY